MPLANRLYFTRVHHSFDGDRVMSNIEWDKWEQKSAQFFAKDEKNVYDYTVYVYERK